MLGYRQAAQFLCTKEFSYCLRQGTPAHTTNLNQWRYWWHLLELTAQRSIIGLMEMAKRGNDSQNIAPCPSNFLQYNNFMINCHWCGPKISAFIAAVLSTSFHEYLTWTQYRVTGWILKTDYEIKNSFLNVVCVVIRWQIIRYMHFAIPLQVQCLLCLIFSNPAHTVHLLPLGHMVIILNV